MPSIVLFVLSGACFLIGVGGNLVALVLYSRRDDASMIGFGFSKYYYGELRRTKPGLFWAALLGVLVAIVLFVAGGLLHGAG